MKEDAKPESIIAMGKRYTALYWSIPQSAALSEEGTPGNQKMGELKMLKGLLECY